MKDLAEWCEEESRQSSARHHGSPFGSVGANHHKQFSERFSEIARALRSYAALRERLEGEAVANELIDAAAEIAEAWESSHHPTTAHRLARAFLSSILNPESEAPREQ